MTQAGDVAKLKGVILSRATKQTLTLSQSARDAGTPNKLLFDICPCKFYLEPCFWTKSFMIEIEPFQGKITSSKIMIDPLIRAKRQILYAKNFIENNFCQSPKQTWCFKKKSGT